MRIYVPGPLLQILRTLTASAVNMAGMILLGGQPSHAAEATAGGASWQIMIDYRNATVDANPAKITPAQISWFDPKDRSNYTLDRGSVDLSAVIASSTGGYFRYARCKLEKAG